MRITCGFDGFGFGVWRNMFGNGHIWTFAIGPVTFFVWRKVKVAE